MYGPLLCSAWQINDFTMLWRLMYENDPEVASEPVCIVSRRNERRMKHGYDTEETIRHRWMDDRKRVESLHFTRKNKVRKAYITREVTLKH